MFLLEHDGKELLAAGGIAVPAGVLVRSAAELRQAHLPPGPWMVKAQVAVGGRGKEGAIRPADTLDDIARILAEFEGVRIKNRPILGFRIEQRVAFVHEAYVSLSVDAEAYAIRLLASDQGGVDVETAAAEQGGVPFALAAPERLAEAAIDLSSRFPEPLGAAIRDALNALAGPFLRYEATLLEINPLFLLADGRWMAGDVKLVLDDSAIPRQPDIRALLERRADAYPESALKLAHGFDYVEIDPEGEIGLVTTGAGLSMKLIDELLAQGLKPINFCDIRTGQFRGDPGRLINVLRWIAARPSARVILVNVFAGITDLGEFARLLLQAIAAVPELRVPIVARLIGRNLDEARRVLAGSAVVVEPDLDRALALATRGLTGARDDR